MLTCLWSPSPKPKVSFLHLASNQWQTLSPEVGTVVVLVT